MTWYYHGHGVVELSADCGNGISTVNDGVVCDYDVSHSDANHKTSQST